MVLVKKGLLFILISFAFWGEVVFAQEESLVNNISVPSKNDNNYAAMSDRELFHFYRESCEKGFTANCFQIYSTFKEEEKSKNAMLFLKRGCQKKTTESDDDNVEDPSLCDVYKDITKKFKGNLPNYYLDKSCPNPKSKIGEKEACKILNEEADYQGSLLIYYTGLALVAISVFLFFHVIFQDQDQHQASENLEDAGRLDDLAKHGVVVKFSRPFFRRYLVPVVNGMKNRKSFKEKYKRPLAAAGLSGVLTPEDFFAFKLFLILVFPVLFIAIRVFLEADWPMSLSFVAGIVGFYYPDLWISGKIETRQKEIIMNMPFAVDMLALSVEAGLDFIAAMAKVIEKSKKNALADEFDTVIREIKIGASRGEALRNFSWRVDLIQISSFCATLIAADSVGASIGPILKSLAVEIRQKKSADIEKEGATAATKILFPMMFLIVPAVMLIVFAPIVIEMMTGK